MFGLSQTSEEFGVIIPIPESNQATFLRDERSDKQGNIPCTGETNCPHPDRSLLKACHSERYIQSGHPDQTGGGVLLPI